MSVSVFEIWLQDYLEWAEAQAAESYAVAPNSYGCGYDRGYADALLAVKHDGAVALTPANRP
jgi:hypothetical protein